MTNFKKWWPQKCNDNFKVKARELPRDETVSSSRTNYGKTLKRALALIIAIRRRACKHTPRIVRFSNINVGEHVRRGADARNNVSEERANGAMTGETLRGLRKKEKKNEPGRGNLRP